MIVQTNEEHAESVALRFVEDGEEIPTAKKKKGGDVIERVEKTYCGRDQNERDHQAGPGFTYTAEQAIQRDGETNEDHLTQEIGEDRQTKHSFVSEDIIGGGGGVPAYDQFSRNVDQAERRGEYHRQINRAGDTSCFLGWMHGISLLYRLLGVKIDQSGPR